MTFSHFCLTEAHDDQKHGRNKWRQVLQYLLTGGSLSFINALVLPLHYGIQLPEAVARANALARVIFPPSTRANVKSIPWLAVHGGSFENGLLLAVLSRCLPRGDGRSRLTSISALWGPETTCSGRTDNRDVHYCQPGKIFQLLSLLHSEIQTPLYFRSLHIVCIFNDTLRNQMGERFCDRKSVTLSKEYPSA